MEVGYKGHLQVPRFESGDAAAENGGLRTPHNTRPEIHQICAVTNNDGGGRTGTVGIRHRRTRPKQDDPGLWWAGFLLLIGRFLAIDY